MQHKRNLYGNINENIIFDSYGLFEFLNYRKFEKINNNANFL